MPLKFTPKNEEEIQPRFAPLPPGDYPFTVMESGEQESKSDKNAGKIMVKLKLNIHGPSSDVHVYDYFADWFSEWKLKHFCESAGLGAEYLSGNLDATDNAWQDRTGVVTLEIAPERVGKDGKTYAAKNEVVDYVVSANAKPADDLADSEIPF